MLVISLPVVLQPGHYLLIKHHHYQQSEKNTLSTENQHINCVIDDFQLTNVTLHSFLKNAQINCLSIALEFPYKQINTKRELIIPFSLRAPPLFNL